MRLLILGATGRTGRRAVEEALATGHEVAALVRRPGSAPPGTEEIVGDVTDPGTLKDALLGKDALLITLAGSPEQGYEILSSAAGAAAEAMDPAGVSRVAMVCSVGTLDHPEGGYRGDRFSEDFKPIFHGHLKALESFRASNLDWTILCPPNLPDGAATGEFEFEIEGLPRGLGADAFTGDVARLMVAVLDDRATFRKRLGVVSRRRG